MRIFTIFPLDTLNIVKQQGIARYAQNHEDYITSLRRELHSNDMIRAAIDEFRRNERQYDFTVKDEAKTLDRFPLYCVNGAYIFSTYRGMGYRVKGRIIECGVFFQDWLSAGLPIMPFQNFAKIYVRTKSGRVEDIDALFSRNQPVSPDAKFLTHIECAT